MDDDCDLGFVCVGGRCGGGQCVDNDGCEPEDVCRAGSCGPGVRCDDDLECAEGSVCRVEGFCADPGRCFGDEDCVGNQLCGEEATCVEPGFCVADEDCFDDRICDGAVCVDAACLDDAECPAGMDCLGGRCDVGPPACFEHGDCGAGQRCAVGRCLVDGPCASDRDCPLRQACDLEDSVCVLAACANVPTLPAGQATQAALVDDGFFFACESANAAPASDTAFRFELDEAASVRFDVEGLEAFFYVLGACTAPPDVAFCGTAAALPAPLEAGEYVLVIERVGGGEGAFEVTLGLQ